MRVSMIGWVAGLLLAATGSCGVDPVTCASGECQPERTVNWQFESGSSEDVDVLLVVDDSAPLPAAVIAAYPRMATVLQNLPPPTNLISPGTAPPSVHVAFIPASSYGRRLMRAHGDARLCLRADGIRSVLVDDLVWSAPKLRRLDGRRFHLPG